MLMVLWQVIVNGFAAAGSFALVGLGFWVIYRVVRFIHFSHAAIFLLGPYLALLLREKAGIPALAAVVLAIVICGCAGVTIDSAVYRPLRRRDASRSVLLLSSLGVYVVLQATIAMCFGNDPVTLREYTVSEGINLFGARVSIVQAITWLLAIVGALFVLGLDKTRHGILMRAVADDVDLVRISGIATDRVVSGTFALGSVYAASAGILACYDTAIAPGVGVVAFLMGAIAAILGGRLGAGGVLLGALVLGLSQHLAVWQVGSQWKDSIAFGILLVFLLCRSRRFVGRIARNVAI